MCELSENIGLRIGFCLREKAAVIKLRQKGNRINHIARALGRSTSVIHRILKKAQAHGYNKDVWLRTLDMRKIPYKTRMRASTFRWDKLRSLWNPWEQWILGESDEPP